MLIERGYDISDWRAKSNMVKKGLVQQVAIPGRLYPSCVSE